MDGTKDDNRKSEDIQEDGEGGGGSRDGDVQKIMPSRARDSKEIGAGERQTRIEFWRHICHCEQPEYPGKGG